MQYWRIENDKVVEGWTLPVGGKIEDFWHSDMTWKPDDGTGIVALGWGYKNGQYIAPKA